MKKIIFLLILGINFQASATIHVIQVWDGYYQFLPSSLTIDLGDTIEWRKLDDPMMYHTVTSTSIPAGAVAFDEPWQMPADTFFQYVPAVAGVYYYECTPHATSFNMVGQFTVNNITGISEKDNADVLMAFPNPVHSTLGFTENLDSDYKIINLNGESLSQGKLESELNVEHLPPGDYLIIIGDKKATIRFTKL